MTQKVMIELIKQHHGSISDAQARLWLNQAMKDFCRKTKILESVFQFTTTADQRIYDLPSDIIYVNSLISSTYSVYFKWKKIYRSLFLINIFLRIYF